MVTKNLGETLAKSFLCRIFVAGLSSSHVSLQHTVFENRAKAHKPLGCIVP